MNYIIKKILCGVIYIISAILLSGCLRQIDTAESLFAALASSVPAQAPEPRPESVKTTAPAASSAGATREPSPAVTPSPAAQIPAPTPSPSRTPPAATPSPAIPEPSATPEEIDIENESDPGQRERGQIIMPEVIYTPDSRYGSPYDADGQLSDKQRSWYFMRNANHQPPDAMRDFDIKQFGGYYLGDINQKRVYLTFDEGYENGYTGAILDTLREYGVQAAFFLTKPYIKSNPELVARMVAEGHIAANHSVNHYSFPDLSNDEIEYELTECADYFTEMTGAQMDMFFRPPEGNYSARTLYTTHTFGYKTIFWSFAYLDWDVNNQPGKEAAYNNVINNLHNGMIMLLHAVSSSNTEALPEIIETILEMGYSFGSLYEL